MSESSTQGMVPVWEGRIPPAVPVQRASEVLLIMEALSRTPAVIGEPKPIPKPYYSQPPEIDK